MLVPKPQVPEVQAQAWPEAPAGGSAQADDAAARALKHIMPHVPSVLQLPEALFMSGADANASWEEAELSGGPPSLQPAPGPSGSAASTAGSSSQPNIAGRAPTATSQAETLTNLKCLLWPGIPGRWKDWMANKCPRVLVNPPSSSPALLRIRNQVCTTSLQGLSVSFDGKAAWKGSLVSQKLVVSKTCSVIKGNCCSLQHVDMYRMCMMQRLWQLCMRSVRSES